MRSSRVAAQTLRLAGDSANQPYVCRACLAQGARQFHSSAPNAAEVPFWKRMQNSIFGTEESKRAEESREASRKKRVESNRGKTPGVRDTKKLNHQVYEIAEVVDSVTHKDYKPANSIAGLERIGSEEWVRSRRADPGEQYVGFMPNKRHQLTNSQWKRVMHHITVELLTLAKAGRDVQQICNAASSSPAAWALTREAHVVSKKDTTEAVFSSPEAESQLLAMIPEEEPQVLSHADSLLAELKGDSIHGWHAEEECMRLSLEEPVVKLAIMKRIMQITGKRVPDIAIAKAETVSDLYNVFKVKEKPKRLHNTHQLQELSTELPNVTVHGRRQTPVHKEKRIGRWKVIEDELAMRNLPVFANPKRQSQTA